MDQTLPLCGRLFPFAVPYAEWTDQPHPISVFSAILDEHLHQLLEIIPLQMCEFKVYRAAEREYTGTVLIEYCLHCPFLLAMLRTTIYNACELSVTMT